MVAGALDDPLGYRESDVGVDADPRLVVADRYHRRAVLLHERQDPLEPRLLAGDGVDQGLALVHRQPGLQRLDDRESIESGRSVSDWTSWIAFARIAGSSASGMPALTSSMWAPASTWASGRARPG